MAEIKEYLWVFPIVGAVFGIITFLAPTANWTYSFYGYSIDWYCWIWGFTTLAASTGYYSASEQGFTTNNTLLAVSIISSIIIAISIVILIIGGVLNKRATQLNMKILKITSIGALLLLIGPIIWLIGADWPTIGPMGSIPGYDFWDWFDANFGIIAPFIGVAITFSGIALYYYYFREITGIRDSKREIIGDRESIKKKPIVAYCPECGQKIKKEGELFCPSCGFKF